MKMMYRQGDVLLIGVRPTDAKRLAREGRDLRENGRVVLAHGEVTPGHAGI